MENFKGAVGSSFKPKSPFTVLFNTEPFEASPFFTQVDTFSLFMLPLFANSRSTEHVWPFENGQLSGPSPTHAEVGTQRLDMGQIV